VNKLAKFVATGCLFGYCPVAPGTAASALIASVLFFLGVFVSGQAEGYWGKDASRIVIDEIVGFLAAVLFLPKFPLMVILGFFIFRFLDIVKPFPAHRSQRLSGGWGVMVDDLVVGSYTNLLLRAVMFLK
jgi:phosphatidylglycerophosphatase A